MQYHYYYVQLYILPFYPYCYDFYILDSSQSYTKWPKKKIVLNVLFNGNSVSKLKCSNFHFGRGTILVSNPKVPFFGPFFSFLQSSICSSNNQNWSLVVSTTIITVPPSWLRAQWSISCPAVNSGLCSIYVPYTFSLFHIYSLATPYKSPIRVLTGACRPCANPTFGIFFYAEIFQ